MRNTYLIARRDYLGYVTAWGFWLGLLLTPLLMGLFMAAPMVAASSQPTRHFVVIDPAGDFEAALDRELEEITARAARAQITATGLLVGDAETAEAAFDAAIERGESVEAALRAAGAPEGLRVPVPDFVKLAPPADTADGLMPYLMGEQLVDGPAGPVPLFAALIVTGEGEVDYISDAITVGGLKALARDAARTMARDRVFREAGVPVSLLDDVRAATPSLVEKRARPASDGGSARVTLADRAPYIASIAMAFLLWTLVFSVVNYLLMGTIEERSNKIFDSLLTSVRLPELLAGKLIAVLAVSLTLMGFWALGGGAVLTAAGSAMPAPARETMMTFIAAAFASSLVIPAAISFVLGYLMYGSMFLALGSLCDTIQEAQTLMTPLIMLLMAPLLMATVAMNDPSSPILGAMAWIPLFTPFLLILRMPTEPPLWEVVGQMGVMIAATLAILWLAAKVYRAGAVHGAGVTDASGWLKRRFGFARAG